MAVSFGLRAALSLADRNRLLEQLRALGYEAKPAFPGSKRVSLASIYIVSDRTARDIDALKRAIESLSPGALEYIEEAPTRKLKRSSPDSIR